MPNEFFTRLNPGFAPQYAHVRARVSWGSTHAGYDETLTLMTRLLWLGAGLEPPVGWSAVACA